MQLKYSSQSFSFKLGKYSHYIAKSTNGYYIVTDDNKTYFSDFLFLSHFSDYYLITISKAEFIVYKVGKEIEQVIKITSTAITHIGKLFEHVILKADADFVKITSDLKMSYVEYTSTSHKKISFSNKQPINLPECDLSIFCNNNMLSSIAVNIYYPYDGNTLTSFYFTDKNMVT